MATASPAIAFVGSDIRVFTWALTSTNTDGAPIGPTEEHYVDRTVQTFGTWGGATAVWQGSNDGTNWSTLTDPFGNAISYTANTNIDAITELPLYVRPNLTVAGSGAAITAIMVARRPRIVGR